MEFEEMQVIWNSQNDEKLFAINEAAMHAHIKRKSKSTLVWLQRFEWMMIGVNFIVAIILTVDAIRDGGPNYQYVVSVMYLVYSIYGVYRRLTRRKGEVHFEETMLGELDKAIWRVEYLLKQGKFMMLWYMLPLILVAALSFALSGKSPLAIAAFLLLLPATYFGMRWEARKWHLPKKRDLESLRETLLEAGDSA
jgi:membrane protein implicated in regulation of membrane protease activity